VAKKGPDGFKYKKSDALFEQHQLIDQLMEQSDLERYWEQDFKSAAAWKSMRKKDGTESRLLLLALLQRVEALAKITAKLRAKAGSKLSFFQTAKWEKVHGPLRVLSDSQAALLKRKLPLNEDDLLAHLHWLITETRSAHSLPIAAVLKVAERLASEQKLQSVTVKALRALKKKVDRHNADAEERKWIRRIDALVQDEQKVRIFPGEAWSDEALGDLAAMDAAQRASWAALLNHCESASAGKPSVKWMTAAQGLIEAVGRDALEARVQRWFPLVDKPRTQTIERWNEWEPNPNLMISGPHADILKGLIWCCANSSRETARALTALALCTYKKVPGVGPRAVKLGNACVWALGQMPGMDGVDQLAVLKVRVKFKTAQKGIVKALNATAERLGIPADELEEMGVPSYGLTDVGVRVEQLGEHTAELRLEPGSKMTLTWLSETAGGKTKRQKSVPAAVKREFADELKELKTAAKDIQKMLPTQRERIDGLFLRKRSWTYPKWRERYRDHPLVGFIARRLIWRFIGGGKSVDAIHVDGALMDAAGQPVDWPDEETKVELWHPIDEEATTITAWRSFLERKQITQPFKQAHREIYILTDAERSTGVYSNRFAAHVLRQHQFNALCAVRGWYNVLRLMVDDEFPPATLKLPGYDMRVEYWIDGIGDEYGTDTNEAGTFLYLATDQVRFFNEHEDGPLNLEQVPALVLSEVFRDVDLFVGVGSVGNDPNWNDGGPDGQHLGYWQSFSFGDLSASAQTRKLILERLVPKLQIADRCSFSDKFLVVRGDIRSYKIHLGSSNILMTPNDQYLCIVQGRGKAASQADKLFLPFEGDRQLSVILSKAFMLAADTRIKDSTIVSQIRR